MNGFIFGKNLRFRSLFSLAAACLICGLFPSCSGWDPWAGDPFPTVTQQRMQKAMDDVLTKYDIPGAVVGVWYPDTGTWVRVKGVAYVEAGVLMQTIDKFRIGSVTKTFTANVVLQLVDEGKIQLEDTLDKYKLSLIVPDEKIITVRQLLNHTSGLFDYTEDEDFQADVDADFSRKWTPKELVEIATSHPAYFLPGGGYRYSNTNYILLGMIVEKVTGRTLALEIQRRIVQPLKLTNTILPSSPPTSGQIARGYVADDEGTLTDVTAIDPSTLWAAGGMTSTLADLKIWAKTLATGELLSEETFQKQVAAFTTDADFQYGLGLMDMWGFLGHDGEIPGYNVAMFYLPEKDGTIIVLFNKTSDANAAVELFQALARIVFPEQFPTE